MNFDYNKDLPSGVVLRVVAVVAFCIAVMAGVIIYTMLKIEPPVNPEPHSEIRPVKSVPGPPVPQRISPEYAPSNGEGSSRMREK